MFFWVFRLFAWLVGFVQVLMGFLFVCLLLLLFLFVCLLLMLLLYSHKRCLDKRAAHLIAGVIFSFDLLLLLLLLHSHNISVKGLPVLMQESFW